MQHSVHIAETVERKRPSRLFGQKVVKHAFQARFSFVIFILFGAVIFLNWVVGRLTIHHMFEMGLVNNDQFAIQMEALNDILVKSSILGLIVVYGVCLVFSHFIAGPIYRFERVLESLGQGKLNIKFQLRRFDEFKEVAVIFNEAMESLRDKIRDHRAQIADKVSQALSLLESSFDKKHMAEKSEISKILKSIKSDDGSLHL